MPHPAQQHPAQQRQRGGAGPRRRPTADNARPRPARAEHAPSELERALDAALARPEPAPLTFAQLGLPAAIVSALARRGIDAPFAIQARTLPDALAGRDVLGRAQTGSGKTLGFGLPMLVRLANSKRGSTAPRGLVLVPTRELAQQVTDSLAPLAQAVGLKLTAVFGGAPYGRQIDALHRGVDVVIATPGRLIDLIDKGACTLHSVDVAVLDEADHMADLGFLPAVTRLLDDIAPGGQRMLFSATLDGGIERIVRRYLSDPAVHAVASAAAAVETMDHCALVVTAYDKVAIMAEVAARPGRTLVFVRTKHGADRLAKQLDRAGVAAAAIHGNLKQNARTRALAGFAAGFPRVLVATDVAARGIHVDDVDLVVHFDPANEAKDYVHRSGRTARAGATGTVLSLVLAGEERAVAAMHRDAQVQATTTRVGPGHAAVRELAESGTVPTPPRPARPVATARPRPSADASRPRPRRAGRSSRSAAVRAA